MFSPGPRRGRSGRRSGLLACGAAALIGLAALLAGPSEARAEVLVTNFDQSATDAFSGLVSGADNYDLAQAFTTGDHAAGYTLTSIEVVVEQAISAAEIDNLDASVWTVDASGRPDTKQFDLTNPASISAATLSDQNKFTGNFAVFTPPANTELDASTTYAVVLTWGITSASANWWGTTADEEDNTSASGWSIANVGFRKLSTTTTWNETRDSGGTTSSRLIRVNGAAKETTANNAATGAPAITGTAQVGQTLTAGQGTIADADGLPATFPDDYAFQWIQVDGSDETDISGATSQTYEPVAGDVGKTLKVKVSFQDSASNDESLTSEATAAVTAAVVTPPPQTPNAVWSADVTAGNRSNGEQVGYVAPAHPLSYSIGSITDDSFDLDGTTYTVWRVAANTSTTGTFHFTVATGDTPAVAPLPSTLLSELSLKVTANASHVDGPDVSTWPLSDATYGDGTSDAALTGYRWTDWDTASEGTSIDPDITSGSIFTIELIRSGGTSTNNAATGAPVITGTAQVGQTLTAGQGSIADADGLPATFPDDYAFQWIQVDGGTETDISGATSQTYEPVAGDVGKTLKVKVSFQDSADNDESLTSEATAAVTAAEDGQVTGVTLTPQNHELEVRWTAVTGAEGYIVEWKSGAEAYDPARSERITSSTTTRQDLTGLDGNTEYTVRVTAITATTPSEVLGPPSAEKMATPLKPTPTILLSTTEGGLIDPIRMIAGVVVVRIQFHVPVRGLEESEFVLTNGEVEEDTMEIVRGQNVNIWTLVTAPTAGETFTFTIPADVIEGGNHAATYSHTTGTPFTATITTTASQPVTGNFTAKFTFSETVRIEQTGEDLTAAFNPDPSQGDDDSLIDVGYRNLSFQRYTIREEDTVFNVVVSPRSNYEGTGTLRLKSGSVTALSNPGRKNLPAELEIRIDTRLPQLQSMTVDGTSVVLTYHEDLDETSVPGAAAFTVTVDGTAASLAATDPVAVSGPTVTLTLAEAPVGGEVLRVRYAKPSSNPLEDLPGNDAANFDRSITVPPAVAVTSTPLLRSAGAASDDTYGLGEAIEVTATFAEAVTVTGTPTFILDVGGTDRTANYVRGTGTAALVFSYTVVAGDSDTDGISWGANALELSGGTILGPDSTAEAIVHVAQAALPGHRVDGTRTAGNVAPTASDRTVTTPEDTAYAFTAGDFNFADGNPDDTLASVKITALETAGDLELDGTDVTLNQVIQKADIDAGNLVFTPAAGASGAGYATFMFRVSDGTAESAADYTMTIDVTAADAIGPRVESIERHAPSASPTNADSLTWRVTFSEDVANVDQSDFAVTGTTATLAVTEATASTVYDVTASGGNLASLDGTVTLGFAPGHNIADTATPANALTATAPTGTDERSWVLDNTAPALVSAVVGGTTLVLAYDEALDGGSVPAAGDYSVSVAGTAAAPSAVAVTGSRVELTLAAAPAEDAAVTVSYTVPATNPVRDGVGNEAAALSARTVDRTLIRLAGGTGDHEGRVEVFHSGRWGTVCDDYWDNRDADVACRMAGYGAGSVEDAGRFRRAHFGEGTLGKIWLDNLRCTGGEASLFDCPRARGIAVGEHNCMARENVGVRCLVTGETAPPRVKETNGIALNAPPGGSWNAGETVEVTVVWTEDVTVSTPAGGEPPKLWIGFSDEAHPHDTGVVRRAVYARGSGTDRTVFTYTLKSGYGPLDLTGGSGDAWRTGLAPDYESVQVYRNSLRLRDGTIVSAGGVPAEVGHAGHPTASLHLEAPGAVGEPSITGAGPDGQWTPGETVEVGISFDRQVLVTTTGGTPSIEIGFLNGQKRRAAYTFGSRTHELIFGYTLTEEDGAQNAILVTADSLSLGGGLIRGWPDLAPAALGHEGGAKQAVPAQVAPPDVAPAGLTGSFSGVPAEHDGRSAFTLGFTMSEAPKAGLSFRTVRDRLFEVTGARLQKAKRAEPGKDRAWNLTFFPGGTGTVTVRMRETRSCDASPRVCTEDGRPLAGALSATIPGPARFSVADAGAREGAGEALDFVVTLSRARTEASAVRYGTSDGTATAGEDYREASGTLTFEAGVTERTVSVPVLDDAHDEGAETMTLTLSDPTSGRIGDGTATGTIVNDDPMPRAWAARFGRTVAEQVLEAVEGRMRASRTPGSELTLAGQRIGLGGAESESESESESEFGAMADAESEVGKTAEADAEPEVGKNGERWLAEWLEGEADEEDRVSWRRGVSDRELLLGSSFGLTMPAGGGLLGGPGGTVSLWGRSSVSRFDGRDGDLGLDGEVVSSLLGGDWALGSGEMTVGLIVGHSRGEGGYRGGSGNGTAGSGTVASTLTGLYPWGRRALSDRLTVWGAAGHGQGTLTLTPEGGGGESRAAMRTDLDLSMVAAGVRGVVLEAPPGGGPELAVTADATGVRTATDGVRGLAAAAGDVTRLRLGLEGTWAVRLDNGGVLTPSLAVGVRHDGGDAETGHGADIGGGIAWSDPVRGLSAELRARGLLSHESDGFRERGLSGTLAWEPEAGGRGPRFDLTHTAGGSSSGGADALFGHRTLAGLGADGDRDDLGNRRLEARFGYGFPALEDRFTWTPEAGISLWDTGRDYTLGWRLVRRSPGRRVSLGSVELSFEARRHEGAGGDAPRHGVGLRLDVRW